VFYRGRDTLVLAIGTSLFGTVDGVHGEAAGHSGFVRPARAASDAYAKLHEHAYSRHRQQLGDDGGHQGAPAPGIAVMEIAPLMPEYPVPHDAVASADCGQIRCNVFSKVRATEGEFVGVAALCR
jgi:hypothetical protein